MDDYQRIIDCIDPSLTNRTEWVQVGMALKLEGQPFEMFDDWSARDSRPGQYQGTDVTRRVWESFHGGSTGSVTGATLTKMARDQGNDPFPKGIGSGGWLDWNDTVTSDGDDMPVQRPSSKPSKPVNFKSRQKPPLQIIDYLSACFKSDDHVNVITSSFKDSEGKSKPYGLGLVRDTVQDYINLIRENADDPDFFGAVFGAYDHEAGAWIRINPINPELPEGKNGISDRDVVSWDNALIECDELSLDDQIRMIKELELPYKALVFSGSRSIHAIVAVNARSFTDYRSRVEWLRQYCIEHGLPVDTQNVNPSRLSRIPGCIRGDKKQELLETAKPVSFDEWREKAIAKDEADHLEVKSFADVINNLPPLAPELIHGILRKGHKMLVAGPPKAGKSFLLIQLAVSIAEGVEWMGYQCEQGRVLYLNFEVDEPSFWNRMNDVYKAKGIEAAHPENIDVLNLRGQAEPMDKLTPKLEQLLARNQYSLVVIDPIYKVITGDENNASDMGKFCNLFDRLGRSGGCSVAYCHHHSKGSQANKSVIDRASGSGVFARDPDAIVDMTELYVSDGDRAEFKARMIEKSVDRVLKSTEQWNNLERFHPDQLMDRVTKQDLVQKHFELFPDHRQSYDAEVEKAEQLGDQPAFRLSATLREFASPPDREIIFSYPIHVSDPTGYLKDMYLQGDNSIQTMNKKKEEKTQKRSDKRREWYEKQRANGNSVSINDAVNHFGESINTIRKWIDDQPGIKRENGWIVREGESAPEQKRKKRPEK